MNNKYVITGLIVLVMIGVITGCSLPKKGTSSQIVATDVATFRTLIEQADIQLVDARTPKEYAEGHIENAINIDVLAKDFTEQASQRLRKEKPIAIYCRSGKRSMMAAQKLCKAGFSGTIYNLTGGYLAYSARK